MDVHTIYPKIINWQQPLFEVGLKRIEKSIWIHIETTNFGIFFSIFYFYKIILGDKISLPVEPILIRRGKLLTRHYFLPKMPKMMDRVVLSTL